MAKLMLKHSVSQQDKDACFSIPRYPIRERKINLFQAFSPLFCCPLIIVIVVFRALTYYPSPSIYILLFYKPLCVADNILYFCYLLEGL